MGQQHGLGWNNCLLRQVRGNSLTEPEGKIDLGGLDRRLLRRWSQALHSSAGCEDEATVGHHQLEQERFILARKRTFLPLKTVQK